MNRDRIVLWDNSSANSQEQNDGFDYVMVSLIVLGACAMFSYWLMNEAILTWRRPEDSISYSLFITAFFVFSHIAILAGFIWLARKVFRLTIAIATIIFVVPGIYVWRSILGAIGATRSSAALLVHLLHQLCSKKG